MFLCEFCEIPRNTFYYRTPPVAASGLSFNFQVIFLPLKEQLAYYTTVALIFVLQDMRWNLILSVKLW